MASVDLSSIAVLPQVFSAFVQTKTEDKAKFVQSGILARSPVLDEFCHGKSNTLNRESWKDLATTDLENVPTTPGADGIYITGGAGITVKGLTTFNEIAVKMIRTQQWAEQKLQDYITGEDAYQAIADRVAYYEARRLQIATLAVLAGVFADNDAAPVGTEHVVGDLTFDASSVSFVEGVTNFTADNLFNAQQTMGDSQGDLSVLAVHSAVFTRMKKNNLIDFKQDSVTGANLATFQGMEVVYDDGMPKSGNVYDSYIFAPGALELGWGSPENATEVVWDPTSSLGLGQKILFRRWIMSIHPMGHAFLGTTSGGGPINGDGSTANSLAHAGSWQRRCPERKQVKIARLKTREA
jgi:hypothetical protein